jgi:hypothetical protein
MPMQALGHVAEAVHCPLVLHTATSDALVHLLVRGLQTPMQPPSTQAWFAHISGGAHMPVMQACTVERSEHLEDPDKHDGGAASVASVMPESASAASMTGPLSFSLSLRVSGRDVLTALSSSEASATELSSAPPASAGVGTSGKPMMSTHAAPIGDSVTSR